MGRCAAYEFCNAVVADVLKGSNMNAAHTVHAANFLAYGILPEGLRFGLAAVGTNERPHAPAFGTTTTSFTAARWLHSPKAGQVQNHRSPSKPVS